MNYYEELWEELNQLMKEEQYNEVILKLEEELKMPYIPAQFEDKYRKLLKEVRNIIAPAGKTKGIISDEEELEKLLFSTKLEEEMIAIQSLKELHVNRYESLLQEYLLHPIYEEIQALLIYLLIEQQNGDEWKLLKDGCEISFIPKYCELPEDSDGFVCAIEFLQEHLAKEPSLFNLCNELLSMQVLQQLPYSYEEEEGEILALSVLKQALIASDDVDKWEKMCQIHGWNSKKVVNF